MTARLVLSDDADADLADILDYSISTFGAAVADDYLLSFEAAFDLLRRHPLAGAMRQDIAPPIHCLPHRSHRIFYDIEGEEIVVQRVLHYAMDAQRHLR